MTEQTPQWLLAIRRYWSELAHVRHGEGASVAPGGMAAGETTGAASVARLPGEGHFHAPDRAGEPQQVETAECGGEGTALSTEATRGV